MTTAPRELLLPARPPRPTEASGAWLTTSLIDSLGQAVIATDLTGLVTYWNPAARELYGWSSEEAVGRRLTELIAPDMHEGLGQRLVEAMAGGEAWSGELSVRHRDGHRFLVLVSDTPVTDQMGQLVGIVGVTTDLSERIAAGAALSELSALVGSAEEAIIGTSPQGIIRSWNPAAERLFGYGREEVLGRPASLVFDDLRGRPAARLLKALQNGEAVRLNGARGFRRDGRQLQILLSAAPVLGAAGPVTAISWVASDMSAEVATKRALAESEYRFRKVFEHSPVGKLLLDPTGRIMAANQAFAAMLGADQDALVGQHVTELLHPRDRGASLEAMAGLFAGDVDTYQVERRYLRRDRSVAWGRVKAVALHEDGRPDLALVVAEDITERVQSRQEHERLLAQLEHQAITDALTRLPNRALLEERLRQALCRLARHPGTVGVMFVDLDRFKVVNDSLGHPAGDALLQAIGARISTVCRSGDTVCRFGGDEFVVVLEDVGGAGELGALAGRVLDAVAAPIELNGVSVLPSLSIGIASTRDPRCSMETLLGDADLAMYRAKGQGGGSYRIFEPEMRERVSSQLAQEAELRSGIEAGHLRAHYQPFVSVAGRIVGVEALVRWCHPVRGYLPPAEFIPLAEETGLIVRLGKWVLREACRQAALWRAADAPQLTLSVNLSTRQLADPGLPAAVGDILAETGLEASALCLEITETALMREPVTASANLGKLRAMGVGIAVDDFGTGYSSLLYLRHLPAQVLKLDRFFVAGLGQNATDTAIIRWAIELAHTLGLSTVAEGVETEKQANLLREMGCDFLQGYYFSPAVDADSLLLLLRDPPAPFLQDPAPPKRR